MVYKGSLFRFWLPLLSAPLLATAQDSTGIVCVADLPHLGKNEMFLGRQARPGLKSVFLVSFDSSPPVPVTIF